MRKKNDNTAANSPEPVVKVGMSSGTAMPEDEDEEPPLLVPLPPLLVVGFWSPVLQPTLPRTTWLLPKLLIASQLKVVEDVSTSKAPATCLIELLKSTLQDRMSVFAKEGTKLHGWTMG